MSNFNRILSGLAATVALLGGLSAADLRAQSSCTDDPFLVSSSNGTTNLPAAGGSTVVSWSKNSGASATCPSFVTTTAPWFTLSNTNSPSTTGSTTVTVAPNLSSATRTGVITVQSSSTDATEFFIVQAGTTFVADSTSLNFTWGGGPVPSAQIVNVSASGGAVAVTATVSSGANWLSVTPGASYTPTPLSIAVNPAALSAGTYQGAVVLSGAGLQINVNVTLVVTSSGTSLTFSPASGTLSLGAGAATPQTLSVNLKNSTSSVPVTFTLSTDQPWLSAASATPNLGPGQSTPVILTVSAPTLAPGAYTAHVIAQGGGLSATYSLTLNVTGASIALSGNPLGLSIQSGAKQTFKNAEQITLATPGASIPVAISVTQGNSFLTADATAQAPGSFSISIDATALAPGTYFGTLLISCTTTSCVPVPLTIQLQVSPGSGSLNFDAAGISFNGASGSSTPLTITANLTDSGSTPIAATISTDQPWLTATPASASLQPGKTTPVAISATAANLKPGQYTGHVLAQASGISETYTVTLMVAGTSVSVTPNPATLTLTAGTRQIFTGLMQLTGDSASVAISVTEGSSYLSADLLSQSPGTFNVTVDATKLTAGNYPGALLLHCTPSCIPIAVALNIVVTQGSSTLTFGTAGATLSGNAGSQSPLNTTATLQNSGSGPSSFSLNSDQTWLSATPVTGTLAVGQSVNISISVATLNLPPGTYTGHLTVAGGAAPAVFTVNLTVAGVSLYVSPSPASFSVAAGTKQTFNSIQVLGGGGPVSISITSGSIWLSADQAVQAPGAFSITVDATYLKPGPYSATLAFQCQQACVPFNLQIDVTVTANANLVFSPASVNITSYQGRTGPTPQALSIRSSDGSAIPFTISNPFSWLSISALTGTTPATLTLTPSLTGVTASVTGNLTFSTPNTQATVLLPVVLNLQPFSINATPAALNLSAVTGTHTQASLAITTVDGGSASIVPSTSNFWLSVPSAATVPGPLAIKVDASLLGTGSYVGAISLACATSNPCSPLQIPVNLSVTLTAILQADQTALTFPVTGAPQSSQVVHLTSSDNSTPIAYTIDPTSIPSWLSLTADRSTTPATLTFSMPNPPAKPASATVNLLSAFGNVSLAVTYTGPTGPSINSSGVVSAGALQTILRPGSWGTIFGTNLSTTAGRDWNSGDFQGSSFPTSLDGVSVSIGGKPAFVRSISPTQINFQAPDGIGAGLVPVTVTNSLGASASVMAIVQNYAPAFFAGVTANSRIYAAATERLSGGTVYIGPAGTSGVRPAKPGENLTLWGTGFGPTTPNVPAGSLFSGSAPLNDSVQILIDATPVTPQYAGITAAGLYQINIVVPNLAPGDHQLSASISGAVTPTGIWLATQ